MIAEILLIWVGHFFLPRPVYPVIQGYRCVTSPWGAVSPAKHKVAPAAEFSAGEKSKAPDAVHGDDGTG